MKDIFKHWMIISKIHFYFHFSGDGSIDEAEFCEVCQNNGVPATEAAEAYKQFSKVR